MNVAIVYHSETGNTQMMAELIRQFSALRRGVHQGAAGRSLSGTVYQTGAHHRRQGGGTVRVLKGIVQVKTEVSTPFGSAQGTALR